MDFVIVASFIRRNEAKEIIGKFTFDAIPKEKHRKFCIQYDLMFYSYP